MNKLIFYSLDFKATDSATNTHEVIVPGLTAGDIFWSEVVIRLAEVFNKKLKTHPTKDK